jgi:hypothetical protein
MISQQGSRVCDSNQNPLAPLVYSKMIFSSKHTNKKMAIEAAMQSIYSPNHRKIWDDKTLNSSSIVKNI